MRTQNAALCENFFHDVAVYVGEAVVATGVAVRQLFVIQAHELQDRGVEIVNVNGLLHGFHAVFVGGTVDDAALHPGPRKPGTERPIVVLPPRVFDGIIEWRSAEFGGPHDQYIVE